MESEDSGSYGGLADVLEPMDDDDDPDAVTSLRHVGAASNRNPPMSVRNPPMSVRNPPMSVRNTPMSVRSTPMSVRSQPMSVRSQPMSARSQPISIRNPPPISVRNPPISVRSSGAGPTSERGRAPIQVQDFAFADTVFGLPDEPAPPSNPIFVNDGPPSSPCVTPLAFPIPSENARGSVTTARTGFGLASVRDAFARSRAEMRELWAGTAEMVEGNRTGAVHTLRRALALWSCFQWSRADVMRAALIGIAVFAAAAAIGATTMDLGDTSTSAGVRAGHTLDQHTGRKIIVHAKR